MTCTVSSLLTRERSPTWGGGDLADGQRRSSLTISASEVPGPLLRSEFLFFFTFF